MSYLVAAYIAFWLLVFFFILSLKTRQHHLEKTLETLEKRIEQL